MVRLARPADAFELLRLYQEDRRNADRAPDDPVLMDLARLESELVDEDRVWCVLEGSEGIEAFAVVEVEPENRIGKVRRLCALGRKRERRRRLVGALAGARSELVARDRIDVLYSTTRSLTLEEQAATLELGFKVLGVFPTALSADESRLNGLSCWYGEGVLSGRRYADFALHPILEPFYELARQALGLPQLAIGETSAAPMGGDAAPRPEGPGEPFRARAQGSGAQSLRGSAPLPPLELIEAPRFVAERFKRLRLRKSLSPNFYPFQSPNALFASADGGVEVYATVSRPAKLGVVIGEHLSAAVDPVALYREIARILYESGVRYVEVINDAADLGGIDAIWRAGYAPCGYFPCLKRAGELRRDFAVFGKSFEFFTYQPQEIDPAYLAFLREFCAARHTIPGRAEVAG